jgi:hypothetical protein
MIRGIPLVLLIVAAWPAAVAAQEGEKDATQDRVKKLIADLGNPDYATREKATTELRKIGRPALAELKKAAAGENEEIKARAKRIIDGILKDSPPPPPKTGARHRTRIFPSPLWPRRRSLEDIRKLLEELSKGWSSPGQRKEPSETDKLFRDLMKRFFKDMDWEKWEKEFKREIPRSLEEMRKWQESLRKSQEKSKEDLEKLREQMRRRRSGQRSRPWGSRHSYTFSNGRVIERYTVGEEEVELIRERDGSVTLIVKTADGGKRRFSASSAEELGKKLPDDAKKYLVRPNGSSWRFRFNGRDFTNPFGRTERDRRKARGALKDFGLRTRPVDGLLQAQLGIEPGRGFVVEGIEKGSPAVAWGLLQYDIVLAVDGMPIGSIRDFCLLLLSRKGDAAPRLDILRRGQRLTLGSARQEKQAEKRD